MQWRQSGNYNCVEFAWDPNGQFEINTSLPQVFATEFTYTNSRRQGRTSDIRLLKAFIFDGVRAPSVHNSITSSVGIQNSGPHHLSYLTLFCEQRPPSEHSRPYIEGRTHHNA